MKPTVNEFREFRKLPDGTVVYPVTRTERFMSHWANEEETIAHRGLDRRKCPVCIANKLTFAAPNR